MINVLFGQMFVFTQCCQLVQYVFTFQDESSSWHQFRGGSQRSKVGAHAHSLVGSSCDQNVKIRSYSNTKLGGGPF